ncbi:hypothetical protein [Mesorhizobium sp. M0814]|uniref:hypothetical protein n=1 Tax=unclassified Mesorhizobium TaxID=325217 RepID=UPI003335C801
MKGSPKKDKDQDKADQRRDDLAKRVLNTPPKPKTEKRPDRSGTPLSKEDRENGRDTK